MRTLEEINADIFAKSVELMALFSELKETTKRRTEFVECANCRAPYQVGPGAFTKGRRFCSDRCRVAFARTKAKV